ncbi:hypothetical protein C2I36_15160 [Rhodobacteraceae bacterium WD3A24]|nr:hypothetical protein C2I36_15160 [Rhodobacteraceae bacterium WD3A24]
MLLGVAIFWGIAVGAYRRQHIQVDLFWQILSPRAQRAVDIFGDIVFAGFMGVFSWMLLGQVRRVMASGQTTFELSIPIWPFHAIAWLGIVLCFVVLLARIAHAFLPGGDDGPSSSLSDSGV